MVFFEIAFDSDDFQLAWQLRERVLRAPLGLTLEAHERAVEKEHFHFGLFNEDDGVNGSGRLLACVSAVPQSQTHAKIRQMAVDPDKQGKGAGRQLMSRMEQALHKRGFRHVHMHARLSARGFYKKLGYTVVGAEFDEVTVPHIKMQKNL